MLLLAKVLTLTRYDLPPSAWVLPALVWQDLLVVLLYAMVDRVTRRSSWIGWGVYGGLVCYAGVNVPIARIFATPLTWSMLRATRGTLADSISHHVGWATLLPVVLVVVAGAVLPVMLRRLQPQLSARARAAVHSVAAGVSRCRSTSVCCRSAERGFTGRRPEGMDSVPHIFRCRIMQVPRMACCREGSSPE